MNIRTFLMPFIGALTYAFRVLAQEAVDMLGVETKITFRMLDENGNS